MQCTKTQQGWTCVDAPSLLLTVTNSFTRAKETHAVAFAQAVAQCPNLETPDTVIAADS